MILLLVLDSAFIAFLLLFFVAMTAATTTFAHHHEKECANRPSTETALLTLISLIPSVVYSIFACDIFSPLRGLIIMIIKFLIQLFTALFCRRRILSI